MNNLKELRKRAGLTQYDVAKKMNVTQPMIYNYERGVNMLTFNQMKQFADLYNCDIEEIYGELKPLEGQKSDNVTIDIINATPCCGSGEDNGKCADEIIGKWIMPTKDFKELTFAKPQDVKQMRVVGDSMEPTIKDGDYVLTDTSHNTFDVDGIYLVRLVNGLAVKRLQAGLKTITISSDNSKYQPITAEAGEVSIVGKIIKILNVKNV